MQDVSIERLRACTAAALIGAALTVFAPLRAAPQSAVVDWNVERFTATDRRVYDYLVSRPAQVWWTPRRRAASPLEGPGWIGRWGPRVTNDPFNRRAGGKCPDFATMFLEALGIALNI